MKKEKGFTIVELLVAIFILSVGIVASLYIFPTGTHIQKSAQMTSVAVQLGQGKMEEIISRSYSEIAVGIVDESYGFDPALTSYRRKTEINYFDPNNPSVPPGSDLGIKKITIQVFWHSPLGVGEKEVKLATLIAQK
ncbi:MAG: type II secretion system protein [Candidatus Pacebacteria bacterium]|nr:type II secretion system protein [Candidatus Paceibacterota bacterium]